MRCVTADAPTENNNREEIETMEPNEQVHQKQKPEFEIELLEERIAPGVMTAPNGTEHGYPGPGAGGTIAAAQYHTAGSDTSFVAY
jgi:hypothetical protein